MPFPAHIHRRGRPGEGRGFTLPELIVVLTVTATIAAVVVPSLSSIGSTRRAAAARMIVRDLTYARERALETGTRTWVVFSPGTNSYSVLAENPASPGRAGAITMQDPANPGRTYVQYLNVGEYPGVLLVSASINGGAEVGFDWLGRPLNNTEVPLSANGTITLTGPVTVTIQRGTGLATTP